MKNRVLFGISVLVLLAYGYVNLALVNQFASPFLAVVFIYFAYMLYKIQNQQQALIEKIDLLAKKQEKSRAEETEEKKK